ncbi:MAG: arylsulfatase [candidate division KSB1 bacterium]|nr:arylsulfatase [candidate division KSB1 bacterium]
MNRRTFLKAAAVGGTSLFFSLQCRGRRRGPANVLLILADDMGWGDLSLHGNSLLSTPNIDRLAREGAEFERFYASPNCPATRASLLTGRHSLKTGVYGITRGEETMRSSEVTLAEILRQNRCATGCFGKWHNGAHYPQDPNGQGFKEFIGFCQGHLNNYFDPILLHNGREIRTSGYITHFLTDQAIRFIEHNRKRPFFCYLAYNVPHSPFQVPDAYFEKFKALGLDDEAACIYGMCENLDDEIGRILRRLDELDLARETYVIFLSDNGPNTERYNAGMRGIKGSPYEGGSRVPCFIRRPGKIQAGLKLQPPAAHYDLLPTLIDLLDLPQPNTLPLDGISFAPLLLGRNESLPKRMLFDYWPPYGSVRTERHHLIIGFDHLELYDILKDPQETQNIAANEPATTEFLFAAYEEWREAVTQNGLEPIPVEIGHRCRAKVVLPAHEAHLFPENGVGIRFAGGAGLANDYISCWTSLKAYAEWPIVVLRGGVYQVSIDYRCGTGGIGVEFFIEIFRQRLTGAIRQAFSPPPLPSPDRVPRREVYEYQWQRLCLGKVRLTAGRTYVRLRLLRLPNAEAMEVKAVCIERC